MLVPYEHLRKPKIIQTDAQLRFRKIARKGSVKPHCVDVDGNQLASIRVVGTSHMSLESLEDIESNNSNQPLTMKYVLLTNCLAAEAVSSQASCHGPRGGAS
jgi:hypothetical protein